MCGIGAILEQPGDPAAARRALCASSVRGGDGAQVAVVGGKDGASLTECGDPGAMERALAAAVGHSAGVVAFHRLAIQGVGDIRAMQPFCFDAAGRLLPADGHARSASATALVVAVNGEIYNARELAGELGAELESGSDCQVLGPLWAAHVGQWDAVLPRLRGEFAGVAFHVPSGTWTLFRDATGVRGLVYAGTESGSKVLAAGSIVGSVAPLLASGLSEQGLGAYSFPPGSWWSSGAPGFHRFHHLPDPCPPLSTEVALRGRDFAVAAVRETLTRAVARRVGNRERPLGCLLSGGLDSSVIAALAAAEMARSGRRRAELQTFAIGLPGSPDLGAARIVAKHIGSTHHEVMVGEADMVGAVRDTVAAIGSFDVTTVRASLGHRLVCKHVKEATDVRVVLTGELADEASGSYLYFGAAPSLAAFDAERRRLVREVHLFDNLRADRSIACWGLEGRVPFADEDFLRLYLALPPVLFAFDALGEAECGAAFIEKQLIRAAFAHLLPASVADRRKNGFSNSVSAGRRDLAHILQERAESEVDDAELAAARARLAGGDSRFRAYAASPAALTKEALWYHRTFAEVHGEAALSIIPHLWLPRFVGDVADPSARALQGLYRGD